MANANLPHVIATAGDWTGLGLCDAGNRHLFFSSHRWDQNAAKAICRRCPVQQDCLEHALTNAELFVWGGTDARERRVLLGRAASRRRPPAAVCGTDSGYYRHIRQLREPACDVCLAAHSAAESRRNKRKRAS